MGKESACNARDAGVVGSIPGSGRSLRGGHGNPLQDFRLENPMDRAVWQLQSMGHKELDMAEGTEHTYMHCDFKKRFCCVCIYQKDFKDVSHQQSVSILRTVQSGSPGLHEAHACLSVTCPRVGSPSWASYSPHYRDCSVAGPEPGSTPDFLHVVHTILKTFNYLV